MRFKRLGREPVDSFAYLISVNDCYELGLSKYQFTQLLNDPTAPVVKVGNKRYLKRDEFVKWIDGVPLTEKESKSD